MGRSDDIFLIKAVNIIINGKTREIQVKGGDYSLMIGEKLMSC